MKSTSLYKLIFASTAVCVLITGVVFWAKANNKTFNNIVITQAQENLLTIARTESQHISISLTDTYDELRVLAENPIVKQSLINKVMDHEKPADDIYSPESLSQTHLTRKIDAMYRLDDKGIVQTRFPWGKGKAGHDYSQRPGVSSVLKNHKPVISDIFKSGSGDYSFTICYPVFEKKQFIGILRALIKLNTIHACLADSNIGVRGYARIIDSDGVIISHPNPEYVQKNAIELIEGKYPDNDWSDLKKIVKRMSYDQEGVGIYHSICWHGEKTSIARKITAFVPMQIPGKRWSLSTVINYDEVSGPIEAHSKNVYISMAVLMAILLGAGVYYYRLNREKAILANDAKSARKLQLINLKMEHEISERRVVERQLRRAKQDAEAANVAKGQFLANMSHEIRTPMNGIIGFSDLLAEEDLTEDQTKYLSMIRDCGTALLDLINDILDFSKIEAGQLDTEMLECSLEGLLDSLNSLMKTEAVNKGLEFTIVSTGPLPKQILTDPTRLRQCLVNLVNNGIKFTENGYVHVNVSMDQEDSGQSFIRFDIADTGIGIPDDKQDAVFESFTQADCSTTRKFGGTGLGLTITKQLTEILGGTLTFFSEVNKGAVFTLTVPTGMDVSNQQLFDKSDNDDSHENEQTFAENSLTGTVLVAEDCPTNQMLIKLLLEKQGLDVTMAGDGYEALQQVEIESFDMIFMDMQMPRMNGYEAVRELRNKGVMTTIIALTANAMTGDEEKCLEAGCDAYLSKPVDQSRLLEVLHQHFATKVSV